MKRISYGKRFRLLEEGYIGHKWFSKGSIFMATGLISFMGNNIFRVYNPDGSLRQDLHTGNGHVNFFLSLSPISKDELLASEECYWFLNDIVEFPKCKICGNSIESKCNFDGYRGSGYCSTKCSSNSELTRSKYKETCIIRYGTSNVSGSDTIKEKKKEGRSKIRIRVIARGSIVP